ncbi:hypothetical protein LJC49_05150 [Ruminococcaceae bacterium OttesenSCG-928-I18]|nr:hypothetical protein [Ruminococcaceae bacterium OttesenSCG-928-I18]
MNREILPETEHKPEDAELLVKMLEQQDALSKNAQSTASLLTFVLQLVNTNLQVMKDQFETVADLKKQMDEAESKKGPS